MHYLNCDPHTHKGSTIIKELTLHLLPQNEVYFCNLLTTSAGYSLLWNYPHNIKNYHHNIFKIYHHNIMNFHQNIKNYHHNIMNYPQNIKNYKAVTTFHSMMLSCAFLPLHQQASACTSEKVKHNHIQNTCE